MAFVAFIGAATLGVASARPLLPSNDTDTFYYDSNNNWVAEHEILCDGSHYDWGDESLANPGTTTQVITSCDPGQPTGKTCYYNVDDHGMWTLVYCT
jgi:hypothetical protein